MSKKRIRGKVCLLAVMLCVAMPQTACADTEDAVIVEENAIIGGDEQEEIRVPVQPSQTQLPQADPVQQDAEKPVKAQNVGEQPEKEEEEVMSSNTVSENTISENSFVVPRSKNGNTVSKGKQGPIRKKTEKRQEEVAKKEDDSAKESKKTDTVSFPLLFTGIVCLGAGITRIIRRLLVAYGKL
nr:hypothetical protein [Lachnospiraceae bacterium]